MKENLENKTLELMIQGGESKIKSVPNLEYALRNISSEYLDPREKTGANGKISKSFNLHQSF